MLATTQHLTFELFPSESPQPNQSDRMKRKLTSKVVMPYWAWLALAPMPLALVISVAWYLAHELSRMSAVLELVGKISEAGLLSQPETEELVKTALTNSQPMAILLACIAAVALLITIQLICSRRMPSALPEAAKV